MDPLIESWDIDLATFGMDITLNHRLAPGHPRKFGFVEREPEPPFKEEPGLKEFLHDASLSGDATEEEIEFLRKLRFKGKTTHCTLLLPGVAKPQRPSPFSHPVADRRVGKNNKVAGLVGLDRDQQNVKLFLREP